MKRMSLRKSIKLFVLKRRFKRAVRRDKGNVRILCPQDSSHFLDSHEPGGAWYGVGHNGQPSPWQNK